MFHKVTMMHLNRNLLLTSSMYSNTRSRIYSALAQMHHHLMLRKIPGSLTGTWKAWS